MFAYNFALMHYRLVGQAMACAQNATDLMVRT
jgi:hypothetical protein